MTSDLDIYRSAHLVMKQHGKDAPIEAAMRADAMLDKAETMACDMLADRGETLAEEQLCESSCRS